MPFVLFWGNAQAKNAIALAFFAMILLLSRRLKVAKRGFTCLAVKCLEREITEHWRTHGNISHDVFLLFTVFHILTPELGWAERSNLYMKIRCKGGACGILALGKACKAEPFGFKKRLLVFKGRNAPQKMLGGGLGREIGGILEHQ